MRVTLPLLVFIWCTFGVPLAQGQIDAVLTNPSACQLSLPITDNNCQSAELYQPNRFQVDVTNAPGTALGTDVYLAEVRLIIEHTWANDIDVTLTSPGGQTIMLTSDNGGGDDNYGDPTTGDCSVYTSFRSEGTCTSIIGAMAPFTDFVYRPEEVFLAFNDETTDPNGVWELAICDDLIGDTGSLEFVELVFQPLTCLAITEATVDAVDSTTVFLSYTPADFCGVVIAEYGPPGFTPGVDSTAGQGQVTLVGCSPLVLTDLAEATTYDLYLRRYCPETGFFSGNTCGVSFTTGCKPGVTSELTNFDADTTCAAVCGSSCPLTGNWRNLDNDHFDWLVYNGSTPTPGTGPSDDISGGGNYVYIETNGNDCPAGAMATLYSACTTLDLSGSADCHLSFNYHMRGINVGFLRLQISLDGGFTWSTLWQRSGHQNNDWQKAYISLAAYADGSAVQFRFQAAKGLGVYGDIALDHIQLYGSTFGDFPAQRYYVDNDGDGFGQPGTFVQSCLMVPPAGYAPDNTDCVDTDPDINPAATEIPCNGIDENCNAAAQDDDPILPPPSVTHDAICSGETAIICTTPAPGNLVFWFTDAAGTQVISSDTCLQPALPPNFGPGPIVYRYYAKEFSPQGCFTVDAAEATITVYPNPAGWVVTQPAICPGDSLDLQQVDLRDTAFTNATLTYYTDYPLTPANQLTDTEVYPVQSTSYPYLLTSEQGCLDSGQVDLTVLTPPQLSFSPSDSFSVCLEGSESLTVTAGAGDYDYLWSTGATTPTITVDGQSIEGASDTLRVTVTDAAGCVSEEEVIVSTTNSIDSVRVLTTPVSTCGGSDGAFSVIPLNGSAPFTYDWTGTNGGSGTVTTQDTFSLTGLSEGAFRVTITDASAVACQVRIRNIRVQGPGFEVEEPTMVQPACAGNSTGSICVNVSGSNNLSYQWSTGADTECIDNLPAGSYAVTISNGPCTTVAEYEIAEPPPLNAFASPREPTCFDTPNGAIFVSAFGGITPYEIDWSDGSMSLTNSSLLSGTYFYTLTDANGCQLMDTVVLGGPDTLRVAVDSLTTISCPGAADGYLLVEGTGGTPGYSYLWEDGSQTPLRFGLAPGTYVVTVTDIRNCTAVRSFTFSDPPPLSLVVDQLVQPLCLGDATGGIYVLPVGGTPPFSYTWSGGIVTSVPRLLNRMIGIYEVVATDSRGCTSDTLSIDLTASSPLDLTVVEQAPTCVGNNDGSLSLQPNGPGPYTYLWNTGDTTAILDDLPVGTYAVTLTDGQGCIYDTTLQVSAPQIFDITPVIDQPSCFGVDDGIIILTVNQSGPASQFIWNDGSQHVQRFDLSPGDYAFTVTDINGCSYESDTFRLSYPEQLMLAGAEIGGLNCPDDNTGFIETDIVGGTQPYTIIWVGQGVSTADIYGLTAGTYRLLVDDARGCPLDTLLTLNAPPALLAQANLLSGEACTAGTADTLVATASGGAAPYTFMWSDSIMGDIYIDPPPDDYALTVTDANNCSIILPTIKVRERFEPLQLDSFVVEGVSCFGGTDASMTAYTSGGSDQLQYLFTPTYMTVTDSQIVARIQLPHYNSYGVTVTDLETGCRVEADPQQPVQPPPLLVSRDAFEVVNCFGGSDGALYVSVTGGVGPYQYEWYRQDTLVATTQDLTFAQSGTYTLIVTDANDCTTTFVDSSVVTVNTVIQIDDSTNYLPVLCDEGDNGGVDLVITGGVPPYEYLWSTGAMTSDLTNVPAGIYSLTVTDADTCRAIFQSIVVPDSSTAILVTDTLVQPPQCFGQNNGYIELTVEGGTPPFSYTWRRDGVFLTNLDGPAHGQLLPGTYTIDITDAADCTETITIDLPGTTVLTTSIVELMDTSGLYATVEGGTPPYTYLWSNGVQTDTLHTDIAGEYMLTITDTNGCIVVDTYQLTHLFGSDPVSRPLVLYPNPTDGRFYLRWQQPATQLTLRMYDVNGREVWTTVQHVTPMADVSLSPALLPSGVYQVLALTADGARWAGRIVIR